MSRSAAIDRRQFIKKSAELAGALVIGFYLPSNTEGALPSSAPKFTPNAWLVIAPDDPVRVLAEEPELGQGSHTYIPMMIAEELEADWSKIRVEQAPTMPSIYKGLRTGASGGVVNSFDEMRRAGAQARDGTVHVVRVTSAVDCGLAVNPDGVRAMTEGGINFALTAVLTGEITIKDSTVEQSNFHDYQVLRIPDSPAIDVHIVHSLEPPSGVGELGAMLVAPAVVNAIFAATAVRIRRLPIDAALLKKTGS